MDIPQFPLLYWLLDNLPKAKYDLANSSMMGVPFKEFLEFSKYNIPDDFNLGADEHYGAKELMGALTEIYGCEPANVVTSTGGSEGNFIVFLALLGHGDEVVVENPSYPPLFLAPQTLGARVVPWQRRYENGFRLDIEALKKRLTKRTRLVVITNLHNPSGVAADEDDIRAAAEVAAEFRAPLLIDEIYLDGAKPPQRTAAMTDNVIVTSSVSKVYGFGGLRTGWIICAEEIASKCYKAKSQTTIAAPYLSEIMSAAGLRNGREKFLKRTGEVVASNHSTVKRWMEANNDVVEWVPSSGGLICFPKYHAKMDSEELCRKLLVEKGVLVSPGKYFGLDGHFRLTYRNPEKDLQAALAGIGEMLRNL